MEKCACLRPTPEIKNKGDLLRESCDLGEEWMAQELFSDLEVRLME